ncbi:MAG: hypothetical protein U5Q16_00730 [Gammaproteobacteria bacterium]|nr:hypothetical protein [Gammaproteobacteria bacterium]
MNFRLKENREGITFASKYGEFQEGDGALIDVGVNIGLPLTENGSISTSGSVSEQDKTVRSTIRNDTRALIDAGYQDVPLIQEWGNPDYDDNWKFFTNAGLDLGNGLEAYAFGNYAEKKVRGGFFYREVTDEPGTFVSGGNRLIFDVADPEGLSSNCPVTPQVRRCDQHRQSSRPVAICSLRWLPGSELFCVHRVLPRRFQSRTFGADNTDWWMVRRPSRGGRRCGSR